MNGQKCLFVVTCKSFSMKEETANIMSHFTMFFLSWKQGEVFAMTHRSEKIRV
jgi:hypothetical protein